MRFASKIAAAALLLLAADAARAADVAFYRPNAGHDAWRETLAAGSGYAEWDFDDVIPGVTEISGTAATEDYVTVTQLMQAASDVEFAGQIVANGSTCPPGPAGCFFGGAHGNVSRAAKQIAIDGVDVTNAPGGTYLTGSTLVMSQTFVVLLPSNPSVVVGGYQLTHSLTSAGLTVTKVIMFAAPPAYQLYNVYSAMLPLEGFNQVQFGSGPVEAFAFPATPNTHDFGSNVATITASSTAHPYVETLTLPGGYPDDLGTWAPAMPDGAFWIDQAAWPKAYVSSVAGHSPQPAYTRVMTANYQITAGAPAAAKPRAAR